MLLCVEAEIQTSLDVLPHDADVIVPVRTALFVVEAEGVEQLVLDGVVVDAAISVQRNRLGSTSAADVGVTPAFEQ